MVSWCGKKKTPDGTNNIRHDAGKTRLGVTDKNTVGFRQAREAAYEKLSGEALSVAHELLPLLPHIDVYTFKRTFQRDGADQIVYALVTGGMSDLENDLASPCQGTWRAAWS